MSELLSAGGDASVLRNLALAYGAFERLGWTPQWAGPQRLIGTSRFIRKKPVDMIVVDCDDNGLRLQCNLADGKEGTVGMQRDKEQAFGPVLEALLQGANAEEVAEWTNAVTALQHETTRVLQQQQADEEAFGSVLRYQGQGHWVTYGLIAINVLVFLLMALGGAGIMEPSGEALLRWGADYEPHTLGGEPWRLLTACFVHIGLLHLALNMYGLYQLGLFLEPILGRLRLALAYLATGLLGNLLSIAWHAGEDRISAGASGAIFGLFGLFLALLTTNLLPQRIRTQLLRSVGFVILINLGYGLTGGVDNSAHIGGLVSGFAIGYAFLPSLRAQRAGHGMAVGVLLLSLLACGAYVGTHRNGQLHFNTALKEVGRLEKQALDHYNSDSVLNAETLQATRLLYDSAQTIMNGTAADRLTGNRAQLRDVIRRYLAQRLRENALLAQRGSATPGTGDSLVQVQAEIRRLSDQMEKLVQ